MEWARKWLVLICCMAMMSCDRPVKVKVQGPAKGMRVASLSPAVTEMLIAIGGWDNLVAVSNYETAESVKDLPRVGDYQTTEWETIARVKPEVMIIQLAADRVPEGMRQKATELGVKLENVRIDRLDDIFTTMLQVGSAAGRSDDAGKAVDRLKSEMAGLKKTCAAQKRARVLIVHDPNGQDVIGPGGYLDDLLGELNADNAAAQMGRAYVSIDREKLIAINPEVVIVLLPGARQEVMSQARRFWNNMPQLSAVQNERVYFVTNEKSLLPGPGVIKLGRELASLIHKVNLNEP